MCIYIYSYVFMYFRYMVYVVFNPNYRNSSSVKSCSPGLSISLLCLSRHTVLTKEVRLG